MVPSLPEAAVGPWVVAVGASGSTGLLDVKTLLAALPAGLPAVVLVVVHRSSEGVSFLRDVLARASSLPVLVADAGDRYLVGTCYIGAAAAHLTLAARGHVALVEGPSHRYRNQTVDLLFASVALHAKHRAIGVVLDGALADGSRGLAAIHHASGTTMVIANRGLPDSGMPANAAYYDGPVDVLGTVAEIAAAIVARVAAPQPS